MPRCAAYSESVVARVRFWFGLSQDALALYLSVSPTLVRAIESGRQDASSGVLGQLLPLLRHVPPDPVAALRPAAADAPAVAGPVAAPTLPPGTTEAPDQAELLFRRKVCRYQAERLARQAAVLARRAQVAGRRWLGAGPARAAGRSGGPAHPRCRCRRPRRLAGRLAPASRPAPARGSRHPLAPTAGAGGRAPGRGRRPHRLGP